MTKSDLQYRFAVKDVIDVAGYKTGCGNEGYTSTYPPASAHAAVVQQLCDAGAIMVGKTKSTMFGEGVDPIDWIEHHCPFNPRGDGYQKPSSSSTGSPVAVAAYPWLDFALGTDTGGSIRAPAGCNGIYGTRPSTGFNSSDGVFPVAEVLDTVGIFTRNASLLHEVGIRTMKPTFALPIIKQKPSFRLIYPIRQPDVTGIDELRWFPRPGEHGGAWEAECALEEAVVKLENHLKCKRSIVVLDDLWESTRPSGQPLTLEEATNKVRPAL